MGPSFDPDTVCRNCATPLVGEFCHRCGQHDRDLDLRFKTLVGEWFSSVFGTDARLWRTLRLLASRPGELSQRYLRGQRAAFVSPLRLYLVASLLLFLVLSWTGSSVVVEGEGEVRSVVTIKTTPASDDPSTKRPAAGEPAADEANDTAGAGAPETESDIERFFGQAGDRILNDRQSFDRTFREQSGRIVILLVPAFALLLQLLFRGARRPYLHHLVFSLHVHALGFFAMALVSPLELVIGRVAGERIGNLTVLGLGVYLFFALRTFYEQSRGRTLVKTLVLLFGYMLVLLVVLLGAFVVTIWLME